MATVPLYGAVRYWHVYCLTIFWKSIEGVKFIIPSNMRFVMSLGKVVFDMVLFKHYFPTGEIIFSFRAFGVYFLYLVAIQCCSHFVMEYECRWTAYNWSPWFFLRSWSRIVIRFVFSIYVFCPLKWYPKVFSNVVYLCCRYTVIIIDEFPFLK